MTYLHRHPRTKKYLFRRAIPLELRAVLGRGREWQESLGTSDLAEAKARIHEISGRVESLFAQARTQAAAQARPDRATSLTPSQVVGIIKAWREAERYRRAEALLADFKSGHAAFEAECRLAGACGYGLETDEPSAALFSGLDAWNDAVEERVRIAATRAGLLISKRDPAHTVAFHMMRDAWRSVLEEEKRWRNLDYSTMPSAPPVLAAIPPAIVPPSAGKTVMEVHRAYCAEVKLSAAIQREHDVVFRRLRDVIGGDRPIRSVSKAQMVELKSLLLRLPTTMTASRRNMCLRELVESAKHDESRMSIATVRKNFGMLATVFNFAMKNGHLEVNPVTGVSPDRNRNEEPARLPYTVEHVRTIFTAPIYTGCKSPARMKEPGSFRPSGAIRWLPLLGLHTGCRLEELAQLLRADVNEDQGIWVLDITTLNDDGKRLKTASSRRKVPIHPNLIELGFLRYVRDLPDRERQVFPELRRDMLGRLSGAWSKWWGKYTDAIGITDQRYVFHSFRHLFKDRCRAARVAEEVHDSLTGHSAKGRSSGRGYGLGIPLPILFEAVASLSWPGFPSHVEVDLE